MWKMGFAELVESWNVILVDPALLGLARAVYDLNIINTLFCFFFCFFLAPFILFGRCPIKILDIIGFLPLPSQLPDESINSGEIIICHFLAFIFFQFSWPLCACPSTALHIVTYFVSNVYINMNFIILCWGSILRYVDKWFSQSIFG